MPTSKGTLKFPSGFSIPIEVPSTEIKTINRNTREIRAILVLEHSLALNTKPKVVKNWHQKAVASLARTLPVNKPKTSTKRKVETPPAETATNVAISEFVERSRSSYKANPTPTHTKLRAVKASPSPKLERVSPVTFTRNTPAGRGSTKQLKDSRGGIYPDAATAAAAYGVSRRQVYEAISKSKGRLFKDLVVGYTGRLIPRWQYYSRVSGKVYPSIFLASKGEKVSSESILVNLRQPENKLDWEVLVVKR